MGSIQCLFLIAAATGAGETVLLDFTADGCAHCRNMEPTLLRLATDGYPVRQIDAPRNPRWTEHYRVTGYPTYILVSDGQEIDRVVGATSQSRLLEMFAKAGYAPPGNATSDAASPSPSPYVRDEGFNLPNRLSRDSRTETIAAAESTGASLAEYRSRNERTASVRPVAYQSSSQSSSAEQTAYLATVRLKIEDATGFSFGTGTVIDTHGGDALVLTCGHIFRQSQGQGRITIDIFDGQQMRSVEGQLVYFDATNADIGFVTFQPGIEIKPVLVAPAMLRPQRGTKVFSIGCDGGQTPSLKRSQVTAVDRYAGPPNVEVAGMPVNGRSGGGLFTDSGLLIGVCNAADQQDDEGIYAALGTIHEKLAEINQSEISRRAEAMFAQTQQPAAGASDTPSRPLSTFASAAKSRPATNTVADSAASSAANAITNTVDNQAAELYVVIPGKAGADGRPQTLFIPSPSPSLLRQLQQEAQSPPDDPATGTRENDFARDFPPNWPKEISSEVQLGQSPQ